MSRSLTSPPLAVFSILLFAFSALPAPGSDEKPVMSIKTITTVKADGSGTFQYDVFLPPAALDFIKAFVTYDLPEDQMCTGVIQYHAGISGWTQEEREGGTACLAKGAFADLNELKSMTTRWFVESAINRLEISDGHFYYDLTVISNTGWENDESLPFAVEDWWILEVPGEVVETNAEKTEGRTLSWDLLKTTEGTHVRAECMIGGGGGGGNGGGGGGGGIFGSDSTLMVAGAVLLLGCCCVVVLVGGGAAFFFLRRKK